VLGVMYMCARGHVYVCLGSCMCVWGINFASVSMIYILDFRTGLCPEYDSVRAYSSTISPFVC
jgi:hypothetical protein